MRVAQLDRASDYGSEGRVFESCHAHFKADIASAFFMRINGLDLCIYFKPRASRLFLVIKKLIKAYILSILPKKGDGMKDIYDNIKKYLCDSLYKAVKKYIGDATEIRLRGDKPLFIKCRNKEINTGYIVSYNEINETFSRLVEFSPYAYKEELVNGYVTIENGWRVGICGTVIEEKGIVRNIKDISSLNIRIAREIKDCSKCIGLDSGNIIIISPPACGKTTLLRDIVRRWSDGGRTIALIDERNEISGTYRGKAGLDIGKRTDVIVNSSKENGFNIALRAFAPDVIAVDEIGSEGDFKAVRQAMVSGVEVLCTVHSTDLDELKSRACFSEIIAERLFDYYIVLRKDIERGNIFKLYNKELINIWQEK